MDFQRRTYNLIRVFTDLVILNIVYAINIVAFNEDNTLYSNQLYFILFITFTLIWLISAKETKLYDEFHTRSKKFETFALFNQALIQLISVTTLFYLLNIQSISKLFVLSYPVALFVFTWLEKFIFRASLEKLRVKGRNLRSILIIGGNEVSLKLYNQILNNPQLGYRVKGFLDEKSIPSLNGQYLGSLSELGKILSNSNIDNVLISVNQFSNSKVDEIIKTCEQHTTRIRLIHGFKKYAANNPNLSIFDKFDISSIHQDRLHSSHWRFIKRSFDIFFSLTVILFVFPILWSVIAILIKLSSKGPILFKQERWGRDNTKFLTLKFRTMKNGSDDKEFIQASKNDPRITKIGSMLRRSNLDELPQFLNVLKGDMSVVGPRPHPTQLNLLAKDKVHFYMLRHLVKPGITGWAQVNGFRGETKDVREMQKRIEYDLWYIENWSFLVDIKIILKTIYKMITGDPKAY
ncbi:UDP-glucose:undecaprenyl-phosphate glucose-1-phosphate transferase [bacterium BMS3Abin04]|nr:UDP-glucose:undecaprenyl-phosphate glucose-1-phosphate transferase [bacterium BMS3Abin04]